MRCGLGHAPRVARGTDAAPLARKRNEKIMPAATTADAGKTLCQYPTLEMREGEEIRPCQNRFPKYPDVTLKVLKGARVRCGEGAKQRILTQVLANSFAPPNR
jgi:hypothetical protein